MKKALIFSRNVFFVLFAIGTYFPGLLWDKLFNKKIIAIGGEIGDKWEWRMFHFHRLISTSAVVQEILADAWHPASLEQLDALVEKYPKKLGERSIIALGECFGLPSDTKQLGVAGFEPSFPAPSRVLFARDRLWYGPHYYFLAVRKKKV